jgi:hypothetical protein
MKRFSRFLVVTVFWALVVYAADSDHKSAHGSITKLDSEAKTVVLKTRKDELTFRFVDSTKVIGVEKAAAGSKSEFKGLSEGSEVIVHYWEGDGQKNAYEIDKVGKNGVKYMDGTVTKVDKDGKSVVVKAADGTEHTFETVGTDTAEAAKKIGKASSKSAKVTVYYIEDSGKKVAHYFETL